MDSIDSKIVNLKEGDAVRVTFNPGTDMMARTIMSTEGVKYFTVEKNRYARMQQKSAPSPITSTVIRGYDSRSDVNYFVLHAEGDTRIGPLKSAYAPIAIEPSAVKELINYSAMEREFAVVKNQLSELKKTDSQRFREKHFPQQPDASLDNHVNS